MYSSTGVKITFKTLKRYFVVKMLDNKKDMMYNKDNLSILMEEYHCTESEKNKMYTWFYSCWNSGSWED